MQGKNLFRIAEKYLYSYQENCERLKTLQFDLDNLRHSGDVHAQNYQINFSGARVYTNPVELHAEKIFSLERQIQRVERNIKPINNLIQDCEKAEKSGSIKAHDYLTILELFYFAENNTKTVITKMNISRSTFYSRRRSLVFKAIGYLGL